MKKEIIQTSGAPEAIGPYSQAVRYNGIIYCSGQIPLDPVTAGLVGDDIELQTRQVMKNLGEVLLSAGSDFSRVLSCSIFLEAMEDFSVVNRIYGGYFPSDPPARQTVEVKGLPKGAKIEISCIAY